MSLAYCNQCERIVEDNTEFCFDKESDCEVEICGLCGTDAVINLPEKDEQ